MFSLAKGKLIRVNSDGSDGELFQTKNSTFTIGTSPFSNCCVSDSSTHLAFEISKDDLGRVIISNKCGAQLFVNGESVSKKRPLYNNSQILIPNNVQFRWIHLQDTAETRESEFAPWSDPGKKSKNKSRWAAEKGRLTTHALHLLSSDQIDSSFEESKNNVVHSFVDENDENGELATVPIIDTACNLNSPTTKKALQDDQNKSVNESISPNNLSVLSMSQMMLTSYVASEYEKTPRIVHSKRESAAYSPQPPPQTPISICLSPSAAAFQSIDQNENSPNRSTSFAIVKSPTTPATRGRINKSMHLIDLTTPHIVGSASTGGPKNYSRHLLKSAIKNATHRFADGKTNTPKTPHTPTKFASMICSTPLTSTTTLSKSCGVSSEEKSEKDISGENIASAAIERDAGVEASPHVLFSTLKDVPSTKQLIVVESTTLSAMENFTGTDGHSQSNAVIDNNSTANNRQLEIETIEHEAATLDSNKSSLVSKITNLSAEEEDALLTTDGDTEENDDEVNEDLLLAESEDDEADTKGDPSFQLQQTSPLTEPTKRQSGEECDVNPSDIVTSNEMDQISINFPAEAADSIMNDLINDLDQSDSHMSSIEKIAGDDDTCNESSIHDQEFSSLHATSSSDSDNATKTDADFSLHNAAVEIDDEVIVLSSQEQSTHVVLCDTNSTFGNASYLAVSQDAIDSTVEQRHPQESSPHVTASNQETSDMTAVVDDEQDSKLVANDCPREANDISQSVDIMQNVETLATVADGAFENPNESNLSTKTPEVCEASAITASTTYDINIATNLSENQFEIDGENSCNPSDDRKSDLSDIGAMFLSESNLLEPDQPASHTGCPDTASNPVNDVGQIECELFEINRNLQENRTETDAVNTSQSIERPAVLDGLEVNAFLDILADTRLNDQTEDKILHSNEIEHNSIQNIETISEIESLNATIAPVEPAEVHEKEAATIFVIDTSIDNGQDGGMVAIEYEDKSDPHSASSTEPNAISIATDVPINDAHQLEPNSAAKLLTSADEQKPNYSVADGSVGDEPSTSNIEDIVIANDSYEEQKNQQQHTEETESVEYNEVVSKDIEAELEIDDAMDDSTSIDALDAFKSSGDEHINATQVAAEVEESVSSEHMHIDQEIVDDETSNAFINAQNDDDDATSAADIQDAFAGIVVESNDIVADTELVHTDEDSTNVNVERSSIQHLDATFSNAEDIGTGEGSQEISIAFANLSADDVNQTIQEPATSKDTPENSEEQHNLEVVNEIDVEPKEIATDLEIDNPEVDIIYDSNELASETGNQHFLNEEDSVNIESAVLISSDDVTGDQPIANNIQEPLESDTDSNDPQRSESVEFGDIGTGPHNVDTITIEFAQDKQPMDCSSSELANEIVVLQTAHENVQVVSFAADDPAVGGPILQESNNSVQQIEDSEEAEIVEKINVEVEDVETYSETENADVNELIAADWCIVSVEGETTDLKKISGDRVSLETAPIDICGVSNTSILDSSGGFKPSLDEQAPDEIADKIAEQIADTTALDQSANVIVQPESLPDEIDSLEPNQIDQIAEIDLGVDVLEDCVIAVENESGIVDLSIANTDANDLTDEQDVEEKLDEHSQTANTSEGFNSCISRESNEESIVYESASIDSTDIRSKDISKTPADNETVIKKIEEYFVTQTDEIEKLNSSADTRQLKSVCVNTDDPISINKADDVKAVPASNIDHQIDVALVKTPAPVQNIDPVHDQKRSEKISPASSKGDENATDPKTPRRKRLAAQSIHVQMSPRTPRQRQIPARLLESTYSTSSIKTPRSSKKLLDKKMPTLLNDKAENTPKVSREQHIPKQNDLIGSGKKRTSNERKVENVDEIDSNEIPKLKRKRLAETIASEPKTSTSAPLINDFSEAQPVESRTARVPPKIGRTRRKLSEHDEPEVGVDTTKRSRRPVKNSSDTANEEAEKDEAETHKRSRRQATLKTVNYMDHEEEKEDVGKLKRGRRPVPAKAPEETKKVESAAKKSNDVEMIEDGAKDPVNKVNVPAPTVEVKRPAPEEVKISKPIRGRSKVAHKSSEIDIDVAIAVLEVPAQSTIKKDSVEQELPKRTRRKRNYSEEETSSEQSKDFAGYADTTTEILSDLNDVNKAKDQIAEEKPASDAPKKTVGTRMKLLVSSSIETAEDEKRKFEENVDTAKPVRANRRAKANIAEVAVGDKGEAAQPSTKKRGRKGAVEEPEVVRQTHQPKKTIRGQSKQTESGTIQDKDTTESNVNPDKSAMKKFPSTEVLVPNDREPEVRAKRGRAAHDTKTIGSHVSAPTKTNEPNQQNEIKTHVVESAAGGEIEPKSTRGRKKNQKEHAAIDENKSSEAPAATVAPEPQRETVTQTALKQRSTRGRKRTQSELTDDNKSSEAAVATVALEQEREKLAKTDAAPESSPKQKATRGRKKNQSELADKNTLSEAVSVKIASEEQREKVAETVATAEPAPKQRSARGRRQIHPEVTDEFKSSGVADAAVASVSVVSVQQRSVVADTDAKTDSAPKQKSARGRKKIQPELAAIDENKSSETAATTVTPDQPQEVASKPKSKKRAKAKDEPSDELTLKRGKIHAEPTDMKKEETQPTAPSSRPTRHPKDGAQDVAVPSSSTAIRKTRSTRSTKK